MNTRHLLAATLVGLSVLSATGATVVGPVEDFRATMVEKVNQSALAPEIQSFVNEKLLPLMNNPVFVAEVTKQNAMGRSLSEIQQICAAWMAAEEEMPIMREMMTNAAANEIRRVFKPIPQVGEVFLMDNQGANVGQNALTTDFWQGDEAKWQKSFNEGKGGVDVGKASLDKSSNEVLQQVSLPIINEEGKVIGAICIGIRVNAF